MIYVVATVDVKPENREAFVAGARKCIAETRNEKGCISYDSHSRPHEAALAGVFEAVHARVGRLDTLAGLGTYLKAIQEADERFTGRAIKNITDASRRSCDIQSIIPIGRTINGGVHHAARSP